MGRLSAQTQNQKLADKLAEVIGKALSSGEFRVIYGEIHPHAAAFEAAVPKVLEKIQQRVTRHPKHLLFLTEFDDLVSECNPAWKDGLMPSWGQAFGQVMSRCYNQANQELRGHRR